MFRPISGNRNFFVEIFWVKILKTDKLTKISFKVRVIGPYKATSKLSANNLLYVAAQAVSTFWFLSTLLTEFFLPHIFWIHYNLVKVVQIQKCNIFFLFLVICFVYKRYIQTVTVKYVQGKEA